MKIRYHGKKYQDRSVQSGSGYYATREGCIESIGYMSIKEAARYAGTSPRTVKRWFNKGLPKYQAGSREKVLVRREEIDAFLQRREVPEMDLDALVEEVVQGLSRKG